MTSLYLTIGHTFHFTYSIRNCILIEVWYKPCYIVIIILITLNYIQAQTWKAVHLYSYNYNSPPVLSPTPENLEEGESFNCKSVQHFGTASTKATGFNVVYKYY